MHTGARWETFPVFLGIAIFAIEGAQPPPPRAPRSAGARLRPAWPDMSRIGQKGVRGSDDGTASVRGRLGPFRAGSGPRPIGTLHGGGWHAIPTHMWIISSTS